MNVPGSGIVVYLIPIGTPGRQTGWRGWAAGEWQDFRKIQVLYRVTKFCTTRYGSDCAIFCRLSMLTDEQCDVYFSALDADLAERYAGEWEVKFSTN